MTIVGPRPERVENVEAYSQEMPEWHFREEVKAGLTGYAQIYGKYNTSAYDKLRLDLMYIENYSLLLDIRLIFQTVRILLSKESTELNDFFGWVEWCIHTGTTFIFACTAALIVPFIEIYTYGINDANYIQPLFAALLTLANAMHCLRLPYKPAVIPTTMARRAWSIWCMLPRLRFMVPTRRCLIPPRIRWTTPYRSTRPRRSPMS